MFAFFLCEHDGGNIDMMRRSGDTMKEEYGGVSRELSGVCCFLLRQKRRVDGGVGEE